MSTQTKRALMICCAKPDPNGTGLEQRTFQNYWCLSQLFDVDLVIQPRNELGVQRANSLPPDIRAVVLPLIDFPYYRVAASSGFGRTFARELFGLMRSDWPVYAAPKENQALSLLQRTLQGPHDIAFFMRLDTAWSLRHVERALGPTIKFMLDLDDLDSRFLLQYASFDSDDRGRELVAATKLRSARIGKVERRLLSAFDIVTFASDHDAAAARRISPAACIRALPNCVELRPEPLPLARPAGLNLLFVGAMGYAPNADAASFFCSEILPLIRRRAAEMPAALTIAGQNPPPNIGALHSPPDVVVTGWVESTIPYYENADICIMPIRIGSGTRFKALEALNFGRPIVSTSIGVEGLGLVPNVHYLRADSAEEFADACLRIARDPVLRDRLIANGRMRIREEFGRDAAFRRLKAALNEIGLSFD